MSGLLAGKHAPCDDQVGRIRKAACCSYDVLTAKELGQANKVHKSFIVVFKDTHCSDTSAIEDKCYQPCKLSTNQSPAVALM